MVYCEHIFGTCSIPGITETELYNAYRLFGSGANSILYFKPQDMSTGF